jgi:predicted alpha/beta hydrolase family esterase
MKQIIMIEWGNTHTSRTDYYEFLKTKRLEPFKEKKSRKKRIAEQSTKQYQSMIPTMPCKQNADYLGRKIRFERHFDFVNNEGTILIGDSLGASFLTKRLSENIFPKRLEQLHLICTPIKDTSDESITNFRPNEDNIPNIQEQTDNIYIYHSTDDPVVPYDQGVLLSKLLPKAKFISFSDRGHFNQETFPELLEKINYYK